MHKIASLAAFTLVSGFLIVGAQAQSAQLPTPANPNPANPIATDGSPLPYRNVGSDAGLSTGRSAFAPVGQALDFGAGTLGTVVGIVPDTVDGLAGR